MRATIKLFSKTAADLLAETTAAVSAGTAGKSITPVVDKPLLKLASGRVRLIPYVKNDQDPNAEAKRKKEMDALKAALEDAAKREKDFSAY